MSFFLSAFQSAPRNANEINLRSGGKSPLINNSVATSVYKLILLLSLFNEIQVPFVEFIRYIPTESVLFLFVTFVNPISDSSVSKLASGFDCTNNAPEFARSFEVPLCKAVFNHFTSDGLPASGMCYVCFFDFE